MLILAANHPPCGGATPDPYDALYDTIIVRKTLDGGVVAPEPESPLLWSDSTYLINKGELTRLLNSLDRFNALSREQITAYPSVKRAILQHHVWTVFDWTTRLSESSLEPRLTQSKLFRLQQGLASTIKKLALSETEIHRLPTSMKVPADFSVQAQDGETGDALKTLFPRDLYNEQGPWVCLAKLDHDVPAMLHTDSAGSRSAFLIFLRLPDGRQETLDYLDRLAAFRSPWVPGKQEPFVNITRQPVMRYLDLHDNPLTPQFPVGTQVALVQQALLISDSEELVLSPLVQSVQLRVYLNVDIDTRRNNQALPPSQVFAEFVLQPREMIKSGNPMRAVAAGEIRYTTTFASGDPIEHPGISHGSNVPRLESCTACHSASGIHSFNSRLELFQNRSLLPPRFTATSPKAIGDSTARLKRTDVSWGLLRGLWRN